MASPESKFANSVCPRCGAGLRCGMVAGDAECWCVQLPRVIPVPAAQANASCFCPGCLKHITDKRQTANNKAARWQ